MSSNDVVTPSHAFFTASFSLKFLRDLSYKTGKLLTISSGSSLLDISRETLSIFPVFKKEFLVHLQEFTYSPFLLKECYCKAHLKPQCVPSLRKFTWFLSTANILWIIWIMKKLKSFNKSIFYENVSGKYY